MRRGQTAVVFEPSSDPADAAILRAMGLRRNTTVRLCRAGEPCIVSILDRSGAGGIEGCRIGLARSLASRLMVEVI
jgi:Fe2+ transport system protein FeoA